VDVLKTLVCFYTLLFTTQKPYKEFIHGQHKCLDLYDVATAAIPIKFCETKKVHIEDLSNLRSFSSGDIVPKSRTFGLGMIKKIDTYNGK